MSLLRKYPLPISGIIVMFFGILMWGRAIRYNMERYEVFVDTVYELKQEFSVVEGSVESPAVIILIDNYNGFIEKVHELDMGVIYYDDDSFYVFNEDYTIAWKYELVYETYGFFLYPNLRRVN